MNRIMILIFVLIFFSISYLKAENTNFKPMKDTSAFKQKLLELSKTTNSISSAFTQVKYLSFMSEKMTTKGLFFFKKINQLRWEYTEPYKYLIVISNGKIVIKDENKTNRYDIESNKMFKEINDIMLNTVQGNILNSKEFKIVFYDNNEHFIAQLFPRTKKMKEYLNNITIYFDKKDYSVAKIKMTELSGDYTDINFHNKKMNTQIPDEKFIVK